MKRTRELLIVVCLLCAGDRALAQRVQFTTQVPNASPYTGAPATTTTPAPAASPPSTYAAPTPNPYTTTTPLGGSYTGGTYGSGSTITSPFTGGYTTPAPAPTTNTWDPYATTSPSSILPGPPVLPYSGTSPAPATTAPAPSIFAPSPNYLNPTPTPTPGAYGGYIQPDGRIAQPQRLRQRILFEGTWLPGSGGSELGVTDLELNGTFLIPFGGGRLPLYITPGFAVHYWNGPDSESFNTVPPPELPPRTYDAYLDLGWKPVFSNWLSADLGARVGLYSDFEKFETDAIRVIARGLGIVTISPTAQLALGVVYLDRYNLKILPAFGILWMPNPDARFDILFPQPKLAYRIRTFGYTEWWAYAAGELGGGAWFVSRANGQDDPYDYNDLRLILGLEWKNQSVPGLGGYFEAGYVFNREVDYAGVNPDFDPDDTLMLRLGVTF